MASSRLTCAYVDVDVEVREDPVSSAEETLGKPSETPKKASAYGILKAVMDALDHKAMPRPDEKLKSIVGAQISGLLRGGYDPVTVRHFAIEIGLSWDNAKGHQRLLGLRQRVLQDDADREYAAHKARQRESAEVTPVDPAVAIAMLNVARKMIVRSADPRTRPAWRVQCARPGCERTATYATPTCSAHGRSS